MSQSTQLSRVSTTTRGSASSKRTRYSSGSRTTSTSKALRRVNKQKNKNMIAFPVKQPFPAQLVTTLRYVDTISITLGGSKNGWQLFSCNGMYDPDISSTGHQPMYFDQLMGIYNHYTVLKSNISVTCLSVLTEPIHQTLFVNDSSSLGGSSLPATIMERTGATSKIFSGACDGIMVSKQKKYWSGGFTFPGDALSRDELQGTAGANPTEQSYYVLYAWSPLTAQLTLSYNVVIEYTAVFDEWVPQVPS